MPFPPGSHIYAYMCTCTCADLCMRVRASTCVVTCVKRLKLSVVPKAPSRLIFETLTETAAHWPAGSRQGSTHLLFPSTVIYKHMPSGLDSFTWPLQMNSGLHVYIISTLPTELSTQPANKLQIQNQIAVCGTHQQSQPSGG